MSKPKITLTPCGEFPDGKSYKIRYVRNSTEWFAFHDHRFYEIFLVKEGYLKHMINGREQVLEPGSLLFIRDFDYHCFMEHNSPQFEFINLSFMDTILTSLFEYLGSGFPSSELLSAEIPSPVILTVKERERLLYSMNEISSINSNNAETDFRILLFEIFTKFFHNYTEKKDDIPLWLEFAYEKMKSYSNFILGEKRLVDLAGKSREHVARQMRKYYNVTPSEYITELKLNYAVNLMQNSNLSVTDICYESGFQNLSWFNKLFKQKYNMPPAKYRKQL